MELKPYQEQVLRDLNAYLERLEKSANLATAFTEHWSERGVRMDDYKNTIPGVPHVCAKVPTAGGKTFIAVNALRPIFDSFARINPGRPQFVVWLVPSLTILEQTQKNLADPSHPYRKRLDNLFGHRVHIFDKADLLMGASFSRDSVRGQLSIVLMSFDSLRAKKKEDRKIYQENGQLASFLRLDGEENTDLPDHDPSSLINVIRSLKPVLVVDESHNAETELSVEMLRNLNPHFIFDLTATPRDNSNIISFVDAMQLKQHHMVKLPVIVANRQNRAEVVESALILRRQLEELAKAEEAKGGAYIRPIILFQAQPKSGNDEAATFSKIKEELIALQIPEEQIKIKTAQINELKGLDLMSRDCPVRYILTINALKEGWDCPFAYILATLADKSSSIDVTQILGRVLRMPHVRQHAAELLNLSFVFTASSTFRQTLDSVVAGLNRSGFSARDYREMTLVESAAPAAPLTQPILPLNPSPAASSPDAPLLAGVSTDWEASALLTPLASPANLPHIGSDGRALTPAQLFVAQIAQQAAAENRDFELKAQTSSSSVPVELESKMNRFTVKEIFADSIVGFRLPQFVQKKPRDGWFAFEAAPDAKPETQLFESDFLLAEFKLSQQASDFDFADIDAEMYRVDIEKQGVGDYAAKPFKLDQRQRDNLKQYFRSQNREANNDNLVHHLFRLLGNMYPLCDQELKAYLKRVVSQMSDEQIMDCLDRDYAYTSKIKAKIKSLAAAHCEKQFASGLENKQIFTQAHYFLPEFLSPANKGPALPKSLYTHEGEINSLEREIIESLAALDNVEWWHRNPSRGKGFRINAAINAYPDFIVKTKSGNILVIETKGDDRDNSDSALKLAQGKLWENYACRMEDKYRYLMIFKDNPIKGAEKLGEAVKKIGMM